jgi:hypothetical protein
VSLDALLQRLDGVRETGPGRYLARCSAHKDRSPSLSIRRLDDGRILVHCFANCPTSEVLGAVGLDFDALYPERALGHYLPRQRQPFYAIDALRATAQEAQIASIVAARIVGGYDVSSDEFDRLWLAAKRLANASLACGADCDDQSANDRLRRHRHALAKATTAEAV